MNEIFHRTSIRSYLNQPVEDEKIERMLQAAMVAPSAGNQQPWEFYIVKDKTTLKKLSQTSPYAACAASAPLAFVACYHVNCRMPEYAQIDMSASVENLLLEADALDLGAVWLGIAPLKERMSAVRMVLGIPEELDAFAIIPCGYPTSIHPQQDRFDKKHIHYIYDFTKLLRLRL